VDASIISQFKNMKKKKGLTMIICGIVFGFAETWYYGWNFTPQSITELVCDLIASALIISGYAVVILSDDL